MDLVALPAFADNYIWMLHDGRQALVVDPGESVPVTQALDRLGLALTAILVTHHHGDHTGGIHELSGRLQGPVHAPARETQPGWQAHDEGDRLEWAGLPFQVIDVPGHTAGHIAYFADQASGGPLLFCGDTLFSGGCGRLFEGTPVQMLQSLDKLAALPDPTRVCCAHEYTLSNLRFARAADPDNADLAAYQAWCEQERAAGRPTLPSTLARERAVNPFLRCREPALIAAARAHGAASADPVPVFAALRQWKNEHR